MLKRVVKTQREFSDRVREAIGLTIYGPPGTRQVVDGIVASEKALLDLDAASNPLAAKLAPSKAAGVEIIDGEKFS